MKAQSDKLLTPPFLALQSKALLLSWFFFLFFFFWSVSPRGAAEMGYYHTLLEIRGVSPSGSLKKMLILGLGRGMEKDH